MDEPVNMEAVSSEPAVKQALTAEQTEKLNLVFKTFDKDGDGLLSKVRRLLLRKVIRYAVDRCTQPP